MSAFVGKDLYAMKAHRNVAMLMSAQKMELRLVEVMPCVRICPAVTNVIVHQALTAIHMWDAKSALVWNVNANHRISLSAVSVFWLVVTMAESVPREPNAFLLLEA